MPKRPHEKLDQEATPSAEEVREALLGLLRLAARSIARDLLAEEQGEAGSHANHKGPRRHDVI